MMRKEFEEGIIKANVVEENGEISCSIEETNRIRAILGLKPLVIDKLQDKVLNTFDSQKR